MFKNIEKKLRELGINNYQKPFLKWVGGKTQIIDSIIKYFPEKINNYHEIFLGGGSVLLVLLSLQKQGKINIISNIYAYDKNKYLIDVFKHIQNKCKNKLFKYVTRYLNNYNNIKNTEIIRKPKTIKEAKTSQESYYYWIRTKYNNGKINPIKMSALFIFLNRTCFRGLYREGPNGFNVPFGNYKKVSFCNKKEFNNIHKLIRNVKFECLDFKKSMEKVKYGDFIYLDPPYISEKGTKSFVSYTFKGFIEHKKLFKLIIELKKKGINFVLNNVKNRKIVKLFNDYNIEIISSKRKINSKNPSSITSEIIISNIHI